MAGLLDLFGGGASDPSALYGGLLSPQQNSALAYRGLLAAAGALGQAAMPSRMPVPIGAALGSAAGAMGQAQDTAGLNAMRGTLLGLQGRELNAKLGLYGAASQPMPPMYGGNDAAAPASGAPAPPPAATAPAPPNLAASVDPNVFGTVVKTAASRNLSPTATTALVAAGISEGGFGAPWTPSAVPDKSSPTGTEESFGPWQLHKGGELDGFLAAGGKPGDVAGQTNFVIDRIEAMHPGFSQISDQKAAAQAVKDFENGKASVGDYASKFPAAQGLLSAYLGSAAGGGAPVPARTAYNANGPGGQLVNMDSGQPLGPLAQDAPPVGQGAPPPSQPAAPSAPGGRAINPAYIAAAQQKAHMYAVLGLPVPADLAAAGALPFAGPKAGAEANAKNQSDLAYAGPIAGSKKRAEFPYTFARPGGALPQVDGSGNPTGAFTTVPTLGARANPDGSTSPAYTQMTPQGPVTTPVPGPPSKLGPGQIKTLENSAAVQPLTLQAPVTKSGPGYTEPLKSDAGTIIPPATAATPIQGPKEYLDDRAKEYSKVETQWGDSVQSAAEAQQRMTAIMSALKQYQSGAFASHLSDIRAGLKAAGINLPDSIAGNPAQAEIVLKNNFGAALQTMKSTGLTRWTQAELFSSQKNMANPDLQPEANLAIGAQTIGTLQWEQQMQRDYSQAKKYGGFLDPQDFQRQWAQANPLQPFVDRAEKDLGPLKGMTARAAQVPDGARQIGTYQGNPVYQLPDGSRKVMQ
jgi:hypothetical protein